MKLKERNCYDQSQQLVVVVVQLKQTKKLRIAILNLLVCVVRRLVVGRSWVRIQVPTGIICGAEI